MLPCHVETRNVSAVYQKQILLLGNKIDAGNNASCVAKLGNIRETCALRVFLETCFLVLPGLYTWVFTVMQIVHSENLNIFLINNICFIFLRC